MHAAAGMGSLVLSAPVWASLLYILNFVRFFRDVFFTLSLRTLALLFFLSVVNKRKKHSSGISEAARLFFRLQWGVRTAAEHGFLADWDWDHKGP